MPTESKELLRQCLILVHEAGQVVMKIYDSGDFAVELKEDNSPLTKADKAANDLIVEGLRKIADYPVISEEGDKEAGPDGIFWLVDPIDGTKEFIKRNGEFTINIALIENGVPILGVVLAPAKNLLYFANPDGAFKQIGNQPPVSIAAKYEADPPMVVASRSHMNDQTEQFITMLGEHQLIQSGSSLKLCLVAEGAASVYPRFGPTSLWDTAAADAVVRRAGGSVTDINGQPLIYNPAQGLLNPFFIVSSAGHDYWKLVDHTEQR